MSKQNGRQRRQLVTYTSEKLARDAGQPDGHPKWVVCHYTDPKSGKTVYLWAYNEALGALALMRHIGWKIGRAGVSHARLEAALAAMPTEERKALLQRVANSIK